jgi:hypothetical protein
MAMAFQGMLEWFSLTEKVHMVNANNATANDKQMTKLDALDNSFEEENHVQCLLWISNICHYIFPISFSFIYK